MANRGSKTSTCIIAVALAVLAAALPARAQSSSRSAHLNPAFANALLAETSTEELTEQLHLDEGQSEQASAILLDFTIAYYELADEWLDRDREITRQAMEVDKARNDAAPGDLSWMVQAKEQSRAFAEFHQWQLTARQTLRTLDSDATARIEALLSHEQQDSFHVLLRNRRRQRTLAPGAHFAAEHVDLVHLFLELDLLSGEEKERVRPLLDRYAEDLDPVLRQRNDLLAEEEAIRLAPREPTELDRAMSEGRLSHEEFVPRYRAQVAREREEEIERKRPLMLAHERLADATIGYYQTCLGLLEPSTIETVTYEYLQTAYPMQAVNAPLTADQFIEQVLSIESLSDVQRSQVATIRDDFWLPHRRDAEKAIMQAMDRRQREWESRIRVDEKWDSLNELLIAAEDRRTDLMKQTISQVVDVLTTAQRSEIEIPDLD